MYMYCSFRSIHLHVNVRYTLLHFQTTHTLLHLYTYIVSVHSLNSCEIVRILNLTTFSPSFTDQQHCRIAKFMSTNYLLLLQGHVLQTKGRSYDGFTSISCGCQPLHGAL